jgi:hypothetical protein
MLFAFAADAAEVGAKAALCIAAVAASAAAPWVFARLQNGEMRRLSAELKAAVADLAEAEDSARDAIAGARETFEAEIAEIVAACSGGDGAASERKSWRNGAGSRTIWSSAPKTRLHTPQDDGGPERMLQTVAGADGWRPHSHSGGCND